MQPFTRRPSAFRRTLSLSLSLSLSLTLTLTLTLPLTLPLPLPLTRYDSVARERLYGEGLLGQAND